ncbi:lipocalin family protein [Vibrio maritimus]|uniref:lipocalin family protein n=1 Tax=Vibrio maritimus TaxID=990268 RepID=UPI0037365640
MKLIRQFMLFSLSLMLLGCTGMPDTVKPVTGFDLDRYLGKWYEVARLDHSFERGLDNVSATYSMNDDGSVKVLNRGWDTEDKEWSEAIGKAKFVEAQDIAHLKVSFFGPFYGSYVVYYLEEDYSVALVSGYNSDYFWILSRTPTIESKKLEQYVELAKNAGFDTASLIYPNHDKAQTN